MTSTSKCVSAFVQAFDTNPLRWIKQCWPWEEGCGINSPAWIAANFTLILAHLASCLYSFEVHTYLKRKLSSGAWTGRRDGWTQGQMVLFTQRSARKSG